MRRSRSSSLHAEHLLLEIKVVDVVLVRHIGRAAVVAEGNVSSPFDQRNKTFHVGLDLGFAGYHLCLVEAAHDAELFPIVVEKLCRVRAAHDLEGEEAVDAAIQEPVKDGANIAVAVRIP